jgi:hypothetical protein
MIIELIVWVENREGKSIGADAAESFARDDELFVGGNDEDPGA